MPRSSALRSNSTLSTRTANIGTDSTFPSLVPFSISILCVGQYLVFIVVT